MTFKFNPFTKKLDIVGGGSGPVPPTVATSYPTDENSPAIPSGNVLNVFGGDSRDDNDFGIQTDGSSGSNTLTVQLTNRVRGTVSTSNATPTVIITDILTSTPGVYEISGSVVAYNLTDVAGASYSVTSGIRSTGASSVEIGTEVTSNFEEVAMVDCDVTVTVSGNNILINVIGLVGKTINWSGLFTYRFVS